MLQCCSKIFINSNKSLAKNTQRKNPFTLDMQVYRICWKRTCNIIKYSVNELKSIRRKTIFIFKAHNDPSWLPLRVYSPQNSYIVNFFLHRLIHLNCSYRLMMMTLRIFTFGYLNGS